ncbi:MAG: tetratricopeptide repeat protein [Lewinellaceae bacterium]|nr:tetratricopeptide repeat protein [Saprospiraceae bacterium]MCB9312028.1 tetratricopeptide repeat protein [Lewinellaceae bacterium]
MATKKPTTSTLRKTPTGDTGSPLLRYAPWLVVALGFALYVNTLFHDYALDDAIVITENMFTQQGISGISGLARYDTFYGFFKEEGKANLVAGGRYRPLTPITFAIEQSLFGGSPFMSHLINALLYGALCALLFFTMRLLLRERMDPDTAAWIALAAAGLFAAHPLHTEVVANIKGRDEILSLFGSLGAWWLVLRAWDTKRPALYAGAAASLFLALLSKENAITFLAVIPVSLWFFRKSWTPAKGIALWPLALATIGFLFIRGSVIGWSTGQPPLEMLNNPFVKLVGNQYVYFSGAERWGTILFTLLLYLKLLVWPVPLTHDYYPRHIAIHDLSDPLVWLSILLHVGLVILIIRGWRSRSLTAFAAFFYLATLSIVSNIVFPVGTNMSERFLFMPSVGFALWLGWLIHKRLQARSAALSWGVLAVVVLLWGAQTIARNPVWKDNYTLFTTDVQTSVNSAKLQNATGGELIAQAILPANEARREAMIREAITHLTRAMEIHPGYKNACLLLGNAYNYLKEYPVSIQWYQQALSLDPGYREATNNLQITYREAGRYMGEVKNDLPASIDYLQKALALDPNDFESNRLMGIAYGIGRQSEEAIRYFTRALEIKPDNAELMVYLGNTWFNAGDPVKGQEWHDRARKQDPQVFERLGIKK